MIGNDTPTRPNQIPLPTTSPEFQDAHLEPRLGPQGAGVRRRQPDEGVEAGARPNWWPANTRLWIDAAMAHE